MPLVRLEVRNEYGLGNPELYSGAVRREDPKAVLDGVAVSGLVGILRQLGDLAGFAAEVFHDLHEQIAATSVRAHRMSSRIEHIESSLPSIEEAIRSQTSHVHFAYLPGSDWHSNIQLEHDLLLCSDLPRFIMDSYEECRDPPRLFLLDKFDGAGAGACLKRYSDPTYFKRVWTAAQMAETDRSMKEKKAEKRKMKGLQTRNAELQHIISLTRHNSSIQFTFSGTDEQSTAAETASASELKLKYDDESCSTSFSSRTRRSCMHPVPSMHSSSDSQDNEHTESMLLVANDDSCSSAISDDFVQSKPIPVSLQDLDSLSLAGEVEVSKTTMPNKDKSAKTVVEGTHNIEFQPGSIGIYDCNAGHAKSEKPSEDTIFDIGSSSCSRAMLPEQDDPQPEIGQVKESILDDERKTSHQEAMPSKQEDLDYDVEILEGNNPIHDGNVSLQRVLSQEMENKKTIVETLPEAECILIDTQETSIKKLSSSTMQMTGGENSDVTAITSNQDLTLSNSENDEKKSPHILNLFEEVTSEAENYLDALNTTDSETEIEADLRKRQESGISSIYYNSRNLTSHDAQEASTSNLDSCNDVAKVPSECFQGTVFSDCISSKSLNSAELVLQTCPTVKEKYPSDDLSRSCQSNKHGILGPDVSYDCSSRINVFNSEIIVDDANAVGMSRLDKSKELCKFVDDPPIKIWTNACLFGVQPSKPPDISVPVINDQNSAPIPHEEHLAEQFPPSNLQHDESFKENSFIFKSNDISDNYLGKKGRFNASSTSSSHAGTSPSHVGTSKSDNAKKTVDSMGSSFYNNCKGRSETSPGSVDDFSKGDLEGIAASQSGEICTSVGPENAVASANKLSFSHFPESHAKPVRSDFVSRVLGDTLQKKSLSESLPSPLKEERCQPSQESTWPEKVAVQFHPESIAKTETESSVKLSSSALCLYPPSPPSPPLKNMKISFHPINGAANTKLNLQFPGGDLHENIEVLMFPSFQLLSGPSSSQKNVSSESDDDTFCRSSPYSSENVASPQTDSGSDSDLWDLEGETKLGDDITPAFESSHKLDLPGLDSLKENNYHPDNLEMNGISDHMLSPLIEQPPPPPLPPLQWRMIKTSLSLKETCSHSSSEFSLKLANPQIEVLQQASSSSPIDGSRTVSRSKSMMETRKDYANSEVKDTEATNPKEMEGMLNQIRKKSLSLRRMADRPTFMPEPPTNVKVAAILEKADAVRQAHVRSDQGEDDSWSDG